MNKRLIILFVALILVVLIVILSSTVFVVRTINVTYPICNEFSPEQVQEVASGVIKQNIFSVSEKKTALLIEEAIPRVKVVDIEKKFPNKLVIHTDLRVPIFAVSVKDTDKFLLIDEDLKVLDIAKDTEISNYTLILGTSVNIGENNIDDFIGIFISTDTSKDYADLVTVFETIYSLNNSFKGAAFCEFFNVIDFKDDEIWITIANNENYFVISRDNIKEDLQKAISSLN